MEGLLEWDGIKNEVRAMDHESRNWQVIYKEKKHDRDKLYQKQLLNFINSITNGEQPLVSGLDGLAVLKIIDAIRISSKTTEKVLVT